MTHLKKPKEISALLVTSKFPPSKGGVQSYLYNTVMNFRKIRVNLFCAKTNEPGFEKIDRVLSKAGHTVNRSALLSGDLGFFKTITHPLIITKFLRSLLHSVKKNDVGIIIFGHVNFFFLAAIFLIKGLRNIPCALVFHGEDIPTVDQKSNSLTRYMFRQPTFVLCNSKFTQNRLLRFVNKRMGTILAYPGVEDRFFDTRDISLSLSTLEDIDIHSKDVIYSVGRLDKRKGHDTVIKAMPEIVSECPDVIYLIGGCGIYKDDLEKMVDRFGLRQFVKFIGLVPEDQIVAFHQAGDVFVMPNRTLEDGDTEGFGIVFLEASACGKPVIGGRAGGAVEAISENITGYLIDPHDVKELVDRVVYLLTHKDQSAQMGEKARDRAWKEFRWPYLAGNLENRIIEALYDHKRKHI